MKNEFCHLHLHTEFSMLDGMCRITHLLAEAERLGMEAVAITDHHTVSGVVNFYKLAQSYGIKPIIGVELNVESIMPDISSDSYHLTVLAKDNLGYANILKLVSLSNLTNDGLVKGKVLEELKQGLIVLSGCPASELDTLLTSDYARARDVALEYRNMLGQNNYYLELQRVGLPGEEEVIKLKCKLAEELNIPLVATNSVHYLKREDAEAHRVLAAIPRMSFEETYLAKSRDEYYLKSAEEMALLFNDLPKAVENAVNIASRCNVFLDFAQRDYPQFPLPVGFTAESYLRSLSYTGLTERVGLNPAPEYLERVEHELEIISKVGSAGYFLIVADIVKYARSQGIITGGRGSAGGSLIAYLLGITAVDPVAYGLSFERFLNPARTLPPGIDLDIDQPGRKKIYSYLAEKYGEDEVAYIPAFNLLTGAEVVRETAIAQGWPAEKIAHLVRFVSRENIQDVDSPANSSDFQEMYQTNPAFKKLIDTARKLEGLPRHLTEHQSGIVISHDSLTNYTALQYVRDGEIITQLDLRSLEAAGLLKIDLLATRHLTAVRCTLKNLQEQDLEKLPLDDARTYRLLQRGDTVGCFDLESEGMRKILKALKPMSIQEIMFALALYRLEEVDKGLADSFIARLHEVENADYPHPLLNSILQETYGHIIYQEQVLRIGVELAGFSYQEAEALRKISVEKDRLKVAALKSKFAKGTLSRGLTTAEANYIFDKLSRYSGYFSCKAQLAAYARTAYLTAYLKEHYPHEYFTSLLNVNYDFDYRFRKYLNLVKSRHIQILPIDINDSQLFATVKDGAIRLGLLMVKSLGRKAAEEIIAKRGDARYASFQDFCTRVDVRLMYQHLENLIKAGAFETFGEKRDQLLKSAQAFSPKPINEEKLKE